ncbi:hypothetical protein DID77_04530 [Candidatus Marinamargulisbacteria bacterium SCGC AG-439-L15]|nr:hypothetical protein DID77_04530 [Candidatus Marinamargulisbacteria bacterium SCGC AG-439-L15]
MNTSSFIKQFGSWPLAYLTQQPFLNYFESSHGYIAYKKNAVLGDPVCSPQKTELLLKSFTKDYPKACFYHIQNHSAKLLAELGYYISCIGQEHILKLDQFKGTWGSHRSLRSGLNKSKRNKVSIIEEPIHDQDHKALQAIHQNWITYRENPYEQQFLCRPLNFSDEKDCRYFFAYKGNQKIAYYCFTPLYKQNQITGYYADNCRYSSSAPNGTCDALLYTALKEFQSEGVKKVSMGLCPFTKLSLSTYKQHPFLETLFKLVYHLNFPRYGYKGISQYTQKFHGETNPIYIASKGPLPLANIFQTWRLTCRHKKSYKPS